MKGKKILALFLAGVMTLSLAACGSGGDNNTQGTAGSSMQATAGNEGGESADAGTTGGVTFPLAEKVSMDVFAMLNGEDDLKDNLTMQTMLEQANLEFNFQSVMGADLGEKRNLLLASGEYPGVFLKSGFTAADIDKYSAQGILLPIEDLIRQYAPNLTAKLDELDGWDYITAADGHVYSLPEIGRRQGAMHTYWINKKWMDNLGLQEPKSLDELYEVLKAFKEQDANGNGDPNDEIPFTTTDVVKPDLLLAYFDMSYDYSTKLAVIDDVLTYVPSADIFKEYIAYITKLYSEGILDKNAFTQRHEQQGAIGQAADVLGSFFDAGAFLTVGRDNDDDYIGLTPFAPEKFPLNTGITPGTLVLTDACENPEIVIAFFDQFYSEEGGILALMGIEGETYRILEDGTWEWIIGEGHGDDIAQVRRTCTIQGAANHPSVWPDFWFDKMSPDIDPDEVYLNGERNRLAADGVVPLPVMRYNDEDAMTIATTTTDINSYIDQYVAQVATGALDLEASWDEYLQTLESMGAGRLYDIYNAAYLEAISK